MFFSGTGLNEATILKSLSKVIDPDLKKDIVTLGFVENIKISGKSVSFDVNLTTPACPVKEQLKSECINAVKSSHSQVEDVYIRMGSKSVTNFVAATDQNNLSLAKVKNVIGVASGKGGVGKSTTTVNIAYTLNQLGARVGILDADVYGPSLTLMTKVGSPTEQRGNLVIPPQVDGIKVISTSMFASAKGAAILRGPMAASIIKQFLTQIEWGELDYLIIDFPPGTGDIQLTLAQNANISGGVIVTTPQEVSLIDVRKAIAMFDVLKVPVLGVIETMSSFICNGCDKEHFIFGQKGGERVAKEFGVPYLGGIPLDESIVTNSDHGVAIVQSHRESRSAQAYQRATENMVRQLSVLQNQQHDALLHFDFKWIQ